MRHARFALLVSTLLWTACAHTGVSDVAPRHAPDLAGAWRSSVVFRSGSFASITDLQFLYVFNAGGTIVESSNYDAAPPVPPAYGIWRRTGPATFEARYEFFTTKAPSRPDDLVSAGWQPSGRGVLTEQITIAADGDSYTSTLRYTPLDADGKPAEGGGDASARGVRLGF
jgi:hypothetical protein